MGSINKKNFSTANRYETGKSHYCSVWWYKTLILWYGEVRKETCELDMKTFILKVTEKVFNITKYNLYCLTTFDILYIRILCDQPH